MAEDGETYPDSERSGGQVDQIASYDQPGSETNGEPTGLEERKEPREPQEYKEPQEHQERQELQDDRDDRSFDREDRERSYDRDSRDDRGDSRGPIDRDDRDDRDGRDDRRGPRRDEYVQRPEEDEEEARNEGTNLFVTGLSRTVTETELSDLFSKYGSVQRCQIMVDPHTRESRGFGFIDLDTVEGATSALETLNGTELGGRPISIEKARRKRPRTPTPGKYFGPPKRGPRGPRSGPGSFRPRRDYPPSSRGPPRYRDYPPRDRGYDRYAGDRYGDRYDRYDRYGGGYPPRDDRDRYRDREYRDAGDRYPPGDYRDRGDRYERAPASPRVYRDEAPAARDRYATGGGEEGDRWR